MLDLIRVLVRRDRKIKYVSPKVAEMSGYAVGELIGQLISALLQDEDRDHVHAL